MISGTYTAPIFSALISVNLTFILTNPIPPPPERPIHLPFPLGVYVYTALVKFYGL